MKYAALLALLVRFLGCSTQCPWPLLDAFRERSAPLTIPGIREVVVTGDDELIVLSEMVGGGRTVRLTRIRQGAEEQLAMLTDTHPVNGDAVIRVGPDRWWYSRAYVIEPGKSARVYFVSGVTQSHVDLARRRPILWMPLRGEPPSGVLISIGDDRTSLAADEVSESEVKPIGSFPTIFPGAGMLPYVTTAERLPDGRIALVSIEEPMNGAPRFTLRLFDHGNVTETALPCAGRMNRWLSTAVDAGGTIGIVGASPSGEVLATLVDPDHAERSSCRVLSAPGETVSDTNPGSPVIVPAGREWFAGWMRSDGHVRLCQFRNLETAPFVVDAGEGAATNALAGELVQVRDEETLTAAWRTDRGMTMRRMPRTLAGFALLMDIERMRCGLLKAIR